MLNLLMFTAVPVAALWLAHLAALIRQPGAQAISLFQHLAAGVVFSAVALELVPELREVDSPAAMSLGFLAGVVTMLVLDRVAERAGVIAPVAIDLVIDGMLVAIGFAAGREGGVVLLVGLTLEAAALGLALAPSLRKRGLAPGRIIAIALGLGLAIWFGTGIGALMTAASGALLAAMLGFGVAALLYLVTEELLTEAHEVEDTPLVTAAFFVGFLIPFLLTFSGG